MGMSPRVALCALLLTAACGASQQEPAPAPGHEPVYPGGAPPEAAGMHDAPMAQAEMYESAPAAPSAGPAPAPAARAGKGATRSRNAPPPPPGKQPAPGQSQVPERRMVFYEGQATLRVTTPRESVAAAVAIVEKAEGYVEQ